MMGGVGGRLNVSLCSYPSRLEQAAALAMQVADQLHAAIQANGKASLAVPGGTTPAPFLQALAGIRLDWQRVCVTLTDERQVDMDHERSNAKLLADNLLQRVAGVRFLPLFSPAQGTAWLAQVAVALRETVLPLDVCVLGMGTDGHFASLFPGAKQLAEGLDIANPEPVLEITADSIPEPRISLSLSALLGARHIHLLITGEEKKQLLQQAQTQLMSGAAPVLPIGALLQHAGERLIIHYAP